MEGPRWERARELFHDAVELPTADRATWLAQRCGDDAEVAAEVRSLLAAHDAAEATASRDGVPRIGNYRIVAPLGEGGFGTVHLAEQHEPVHRQVALKVLRPGMDSAQVVARFALEREALARMSHPNIAQIFDAGTTVDGMPFFAMEFVDGASLVPYCDRRRMPLAERLRLFVQVCRGVHHAHQKGVIHRDLKPSNVLVATVDGTPVPKIIDFGIAKALAGSDGADPAQATIEGRCLGTPGYMSPEQADLAGGHVDVRTDVYSLGVLLFELLTGRLPHDPGQIRERGLLGYLQLVREVDPPRPSTTATGTAPADAATRGTTTTALRRRLRGDLDWITLKALERDPARRYQSADDIAEDLERHLRHEPVLAGPPGLGYRLQKLVRRHRAVAASSVAILLALVFGLAVALWQYGIARDALQAAIGHRLSAQAINLAEESPTLALLLAIEGAERAPGEDADAALYTAIGRQREVRQGIVHDGMPYWVATSADGRCMLSGDDSRLVLCRDLADGTVRHRFDQHEHRLTGVAIDATGRFGASCDEGGNVRLYDLRGGTQVAHWPLPAPVAGAVFADAQGTLLTAGADGVLRRCTPAGETSELTRQPQPLQAVQLAGDGDTVALLRADHTLVLHHLSGVASPTVMTLPPHPSPVDRETPATLQFSADGRWLVALTSNGNLVVVDRTTPTDVWQVSALGCWCFALASRANLLSFCEQHGTLASVDLATRRRIPLPPTKRPMDRMAMDPDGYTLAANTYRQPVLRLYDPVLGRHLGALRGDNHGLYGATVSADGEFADALGHNSTAHRWRTAVFDEQRRLAQRIARGTLRGALPIPPGDLAVCWHTTDGSSRYTLVDVVRDVTLADLGSIAGDEPRVTLAPRLDAVVVDWTEGTVVLALPDGKPLFRSRRRLERPRCTADLSHLIARSGQRVQAFDLRHGTCVFDVENPGTEYADITADGASVLTVDGSRNSTTVWSVATRTPRWTVQHAAFAFDARFTMDGRQVVAFANDTVVRVVDVATGAPVRQLRMPTGDFGWVLPDPSGRFVAVQTPEETSVFELATGQRRLRWAPDDRAEFFEEIAFAADGTLLLASMPDGRYWRVPTDPLATARRLAPRPLTAAECQRYELPPAAASTPAPQASRELVDAALAQLDRNDVTAADVDAAQAALDHARTLRPRPLLRFHLAQAAVLSRRAELRGAGPEAAELAPALAAAKTLLEGGGVGAVRALQARPALQWLRRQAAFAALLAGSGK